jgi:hypothetical protein
LTYQLRLHLHGLIERIPVLNRYRLTKFGLRAALFISRLYIRTIRPEMCLIEPHALSIDKQIHSFCQEQKLAA